MKISFVGFGEICVDIFHVLSTLPGSRNLDRLKALP